jgi:hypothetical protein
MGRLRAGLVLVALCWSRIWSASQLPLCMSYMRLGTRIKRALESVSVVAEWLL